MSPVTIKKQQSFTGHKDCVYTLERGPETGSFYSAGADGLVAEWNLSRPDEGKLLAQANTSVYALKFLEEENLLVVGQNFDGIRLINLKSRKEQGSLKLNQAAIFTIEAYNNKLYIGSGDGTLWVVSLNPLRIIHQEKISEKSIRAIRIFPEKAEFVAGLSDNTIKVIDLNNYTLKQVIEAHKNSVFTLTYSPGNQYLLSGSRDAHLNIWSNKEGGAYRKLDGIVAHMYTINHIEYSPEGRFFASCSMDKSIKLWDASSFRLLKVIDRARHAGHGTSVNRLLWMDEQTLISASDDRTVSVWEIEINE